MLDIYVDADACPVKYEIERVADRQVLTVTMVSNGGMRPSAHPRFHHVTVGGGTDAADDWIAEHIAAFDIAITADVLLASRCLEKGASVVGPSGKLLTRENIGTALGNVDPTLEEAAACLGARPWQTFRRILVPLTRAGTVAGALTVFGWSIGTFAEPLLLGSANEQRALAWTVYQRGVVQTDYGLSTAMGVVLLGVAFVVTYLSLRYSRGALVE